LIGIMAGPRNSKRRYDPQFERILAQGLLARISRSGIGLIWLNHSISALESMIATLPFEIAASGLNIFGLAVLWYFESEEDECIESKSHF
jgi:hypothetical protein